MKIKLINEIEVDDKLKDYLLIIEEALQARIGYLYVDFDNGDRHNSQSMWKGMTENDVLVRLIFEQDKIKKIIEKGDLNE